MLKRLKEMLYGARIHEKFVNARHDFLHQLSKLIRENQTIGLEDLQITNMFKNHKLAKFIQTLCGLNL